MGGDDDDGGAAVGEHRGVVFFPVGVLLSGGDAVDVAEGEAEFVGVGVVGGEDAGLAFKDDEGTSLLGGNEQRAVGVAAQVKLIKMGGRLVRHPRRLIFQLSEVSVPRRLFEGVLDRIGRLSPAPN